MNAHYSGWEMKSRHEDLDDAAADGIGDKDVQDQWFSVQDLEICCNRLCILILHRDPCISDTHIENCDKINNVCRDYLSDAQQQ